MKDMSNMSEENKERILSWMMILLMRLYGQNVYSEESYILKVYDSKTTEDIDRFFEGILSDFKYKKREIAKLKKLEAKATEILSR